MKKISNPLTMIGIFAGIAEVAGTVVLPFVSSELQNVFIWYVMLFPVFLVSLFFYTLIKHNRLLYSPSDYQDEKNYLHAIYGTSEELDQIIDDPNTNQALKEKLQGINSEILTAVNNSELEVMSNPTKEKIISFLKDGKKMKARDIEEKLLLRTGTVNRIYNESIHNTNLPKILDREQVAEEVDKYNRSHYVYFLHSN